MPPAAVTSGQAKEEHELPFAPPSTVRARALLDDFVQERGLPHRCQQEATIVLGELVSNALDHGSPMPGECFTVAFAFGDSGLTITVRDGGSAGEPRVVNAGPYAARGRGLAMVQALCVDWHVDRHGGRGTQVRATLGC